MKIKAVHAREIYNSRGWPTVCCELVLEDGYVATASVPTGLSRGSYEAVTLFDGGDRLWGRGVRNCVKTIEEIIAPKLVGEELHAIHMDLKLIELDGTPDRSQFGANTILAVSMALYRAHAHQEQVSVFEFIGHVLGAESVTLPFPLFNVINGGLHANNGLQIQEFLVTPVGSTDFKTSMEYGVLFFHELGKTLTKYGKDPIIGDEGGYASRFAHDMQAFDVLIETITRVRETRGVDMRIALDVAASRFYDASAQVYRWDSKSLTSAELIEFYTTLIEKYPIFSIEDGLAEDDWEGWKLMTKVLGQTIQIVGDDLFATHASRISYGAETQAATAVLIKPDQVGTVTETLQAIRLCRESSLTPIASHRSGETEDTFIADLAVGASIGQIKAGGPTRGERMAKYNRLLTLEDRLQRQG